MVAEHKNAANPFATKEEPKKDEPKKDAKPAHKETSIWEHTHADTPKKFDIYACIESAFILKS